MSRSSKKQDSKAPPPVISLVPKILPEVPGQFAANILWLQTNWTNYKDQWVALYKGKLVANCASREELEPKIINHPFLSNIMCLKVGQDYSE
jgi:hypothetical protein